MLSGSMPNDDKWIISSSGKNMFVRLTVGVLLSATGFLAKFHYGKEVKNQLSV